MVTLDQLKNGANLFHYTGPRYRKGKHLMQQCTRVIGPRGGITEDIMVFRASGQLKTWKTRPNEFRLPVKFGMSCHGSAAITDGNAGYWHVADDCPLSIEATDSEVTEGE